MEERLVFDDLAGPRRPPSREEHDWLARLAAETAPAEHVVALGRSRAATEVGPLLELQLDGSWRAGRYIGELRREGRVLEIRPRLGIPTIARWAGAALNVRVLPEAAEHTGSSVLIAELVAATWRSALIDAARDGLPGFRQPRRHVGADVRGRLDLPATIASRAVRQPAVASTSRPRIFDNPVSRSIVLADRVLDRRLRRADWRGNRVGELMPRLQAATGRRPALPTRRELDRVRYTPITQRYRRVAELSWEIARNRGLRAAATAEAADGMLIDVAELWELFLVHCARRAFGASEVLHGTRDLEARHLMQSTTGKPGLGRLYPDLLIGAVDAPAAIVDAKYKRLADPRGVDREDLYQLSAYLVAHSSGPQRPEGMLAYPAFDDQVRSRAERDGPWTDPAGRPVSFRRLPTEEADCIRALQAAIAHGAGPGGRRRAPQGSTVLTMT